MFTPYADDELPAGFKYPERLLDMVASSAACELAPWVFVDAASPVGKLAYSVRKHDGRNLVPFASVEDDRKDIACFDGNDTTGNPAVLMLVLDESGRSYGYRDFDEWLEAARADAQGYAG